MGIFDFLTGSSKSTNTVPDWVKQPIMDNVQRATNIANMGYTPYYGPDVAAFTPMQNAAFDGTNQAAAAFGMPTASGNGMPKPQTFAGGVQGYSSAPMYQQALAALKKNDPTRYAALTGMNSASGQQTSQNVPMMPKGYPVQVWNTLTQAQKDNVLKKFGGSGLVPVPTYRGGDSGGVAAHQAGSTGGFGFNMPSIGRGGITIGQSGSLFGGNSWG